MTLDELLQLVTDRETARMADGIEKLPAMDFIERIVQEAPPRGVEATVWMPPVIQSLNRKEVRLVTFSHFRSAYSVIERMARVLTPAAIEFDLLPMIVPFNPKHLRGMTKYTPFIRRVQERGTILYRADRV